MILKRNQISQEVFGSKKNKKIINFIVEILKRQNIGEVFKKQTISYEFEELDLLKKIGKLLLWIEENECPNLRTNKETENLIKFLIESYNTGKEINVFALFCPSYKKGKAEVGFKIEIGETTKKGLHNLNLIVKKFKEFGFNTNGLAVYSDLALENFDKLLKKDLADLETNYNSFSEFGFKFDLAITKLSEIGSCFNSIGFQGINSETCDYNDEKIEALVLRSKPFYEEVLGWKVEDIKKRTINLINSCSKMGEEIRKLNPLSVMLITENMYERAKFYYASMEENPLPIVYPAKIKTKIGELKE